MELAGIGIKGKRGAQLNCSESKYGMAAVLYFLGDGHAGVWSLYQQMGRASQRDEILDWFHLTEKLHKVGGPMKRLKQAEGLLWEGKVEEASQLFEGLRSK